MDYQAYNGVITVDGACITITHTGMIADTGGLVLDQPRRVPLQAVSGVALKQPTRLLNGWLTLGLGGPEAAQLTLRAAPSNPDTVIFRHKHRVRFEELHDWLASVARQNHANNVDFSTVAFPAAAQTRLEREAVETEARAAQHAERTEAKMTAILGVERPDIAVAAARVAWRFGGQAELKKLVSHLYEGEFVRLIAQGAYQHKWGMLVLTNVRLFFLFDGYLSPAKEDFPLQLICSVRRGSNQGVGEIQVPIGGNTAVITGILDNDLGALADAVREGIATQAPYAAAQGAAAAPTADPYESLRQLGSLRDANLLTETEFQWKKQEILERM